MKITDTMIKRSCSPTIYKRGVEYFHEGRVHLNRRSDTILTALVDGENIYNVSIKFENGTISDCMCTCPYYETMHSSCKHIVAVLLQRKSELDNNLDFTDENDNLASGLCSSFAKQSLSKTPLDIHFILHINSHSVSPYSMSVEIGSSGIIHGIENFLAKYLSGSAFKISKSETYSTASELTPAEHHILSILAEAYENRANEAPLYTKAIYQTSFGSITLKRLLEKLPDTNFSIIFNGLTLSDVRFVNEDPDIIIDLTTDGTEITLSVSDRGFALTGDGEYFLYDNIIYHTSSDFRSYYMPIYSALDKGGRTQISFRGNNTMLFASQVLPHIKNRHGVISHGIDELVVNEIPQFTIYFDSRQNGVTAVIIARYGAVNIRLGTDAYDDDRIIVRDINSERKIMSFFNDFTFENGTFVLSDDELIYSFIKYTIHELAPFAELIFSDSFKSIQVSDTINISANISYNSKIDLLEADFESELSTDEIYAILASVKLKERYYRRPDGSFISLESNKNRYIFDLLEHLEFSPSEISARSKLLPKYHSLYLNALDGVNKDSSFLEYIEKIRKIEPQISPELDKILRFYQKDGIKWLKQLSALGFGGILADDMGLGKTLQVLAYIHSEKPDEPVLIVTPSALTYNWYNEIQRFTPSLKSLIIDGTREERLCSIKTIDDFDIIITSYPILRRDIELYQKRYFSYCFIDEAQYIKNPRTMNARCVKKINAGHKFALTGTPIENSMSELWSIFDFIMSGYLYDLKTFRSIYESPLIKSGDLAIKDDLRAKIKPFILRRMKSEVLSELPEKLEYTVFADLTSDQRKMYSSYLSLAKNRTISLLKAGGRNRMEILTLLMRLRQICCHPSLFDENYNFDSGKLRLLMELTENAVESGHRLLIFSQYTSMLEIIRSELNKKNLRSFYLDGKTPSYERSEMTDRFNGGERDIFLISLRAGGTGLNLTGADMVIHYDPWWNPAAMDQASDRAYRIGQKRDVQVIRLVSKNTIEEKILKLQDAKRSLADNLIASNNDTLSSLSNDEIISLFD